MPSGPKKRKAARKQKQADEVPSSQGAQEQLESSKEDEKTMDDDAEAIRGEESREDTEALKATDWDENGDSRGTGKEQNISYQDGVSENKTCLEESSASVAKAKASYTPAQQDSAAKDQLHQEISARISNTAMVENDTELNANGETTIDFPGNQYDDLQTEVRNIDVETESVSVTEPGRIPPVQEGIEDFAHPRTTEVEPENDVPVEPKAEDTAREPYVEGSTESHEDSNKTIAEPQVAKQLVPDGSQCEGLARFPVPGSSERVSSVEYEKVTEAVPASDAKVHIPDTEQETWYIIDKDAAIQQDIVAESAVDDKDEVDIAVERVALTQLPAELNVNVKPENEANCDAEPQTVDSEIEATPKKIEPEGIVSAAVGLVSIDDTPTEVKPSQAETVAAVGMVSLLDIETPLERKLKPEVLSSVGMELETAAAESVPSVEFTAAETGSTMETESETVPLKLPQFSDEITISDQQYLAEVESDKVRADEEEKNGDICELVVDDLIDIRIEKNRLLQHESVPQGGTETEIISPVENEAHVDVHALITDEQERIFNAEVEKKIVSFKTMPNPEFTAGTTKSEEIRITTTYPTDETLAQNQRDIMEYELDQGFEAQKKTRCTSDLSLVEDIAEIKIEELKQENSLNKGELITYSSHVETKLVDAGMVSDIKIVSMAEAESKDAEIIVTESTVTQCHEDVTPKLHQTSENEDIEHSFVFPENLNEETRSNQHAPVDDDVQVKVKVVCLAGFEPLLEKESSIEDETELETIEESIAASKVIALQEVAGIRTHEEILNSQIETRSGQVCICDVQKSGKPAEIETILPVNIQTQLEMEAPTRDEEKPKAANESGSISPTRDEEKPKAANESGSISPIRTADLSAGSETESLGENEENAFDLAVAESFVKASGPDQPDEMPPSREETEGICKLVEEPMAIQVEEIQEVQRESNFIPVSVDGNAPTGMEQNEADTITPVKFELLTSNAQSDPAAVNSAKFRVGTVTELPNIEEFSRPNDENEGHILIEEVSVTEINQGGMNVCVPHDAEREKHEYFSTGDEVESSSQKKQEILVIKEGSEASLAEETKGVLGTKGSQISSTDIEGQVNGVMTESCMEYGIGGHELQNSEDVAESGHCAIEEPSVNEQEKDVGEDDTMSSLIAEVGSAHTDFDSQELDGVLSPTASEESNFDSKGFTSRPATPEFVDLYFKNEDSGENPCIESSEGNFGLCISDSDVKETSVSARVVSEELDSAEIVTGDIDTDAEVVKAVCEPSVKEVIVRSTTSKASDKAFTGDIERVASKELDSAKADIGVDTEIVKVVCQSCVTEEIILCTANSNFSVKAGSGGIGESVAPEELDTTKAAAGDSGRVLSEESDSAKVVVNDIDEESEEVKAVCEPCVTEEAIVSTANSKFLVIETGDPSRNLENAILETEDNIEENIVEDLKSKNSIDYSNVHDRGIDSGFRNGEAVTELELTENDEDRKITSLYGNKRKQAAILPEECIQISQETRLSIKSEEKLLEGAISTDEIFIECIDPNGNNMPIDNANGAVIHHSESIQERDLPVVTTPKERAVKYVNDTNEGKSFAPRKITERSNWLGCCGLLDLLLSKDR